MGAVTPITFHHVALRHGQRVVLSDVTGVLAPGSLTALVGSNGTGKTTLLRAIAGLHPVAAGTIDRGALRPADIALLAQGSHLDRSFPITCLEVVALAGPRVGVLRAIGRDRLAAARAALAKVGLEGFERRHIEALSAGQFQRVLFARTIAQDAALILLDEPFTNVDTDTVAILLSVIADWHAQGRTVVAVLHDLDLARRYFPQVVTLADGHATWFPQPPIGLIRAA
ncbi:MAG TPA: ATP-binding cassette domain-containing protein [Rhodopila sp.]|uniref:metal ABC transporter ATP-binding protein n=1 Tax=Rhodopila sp. TaxID=2480087 RepID=UPI002CE76F4F|nr:ATP-binding cassette domain-containing protein [Rhodopila sp.]HVY16717.1 ATP-binding cassette domain-containing protein [Rhodopila sp.]